MQHVKEKTLEVSRNLISYYTCDFQMGEYVEFDEAYPSTAALKTEGLRGELRA